LDSIKEKEHEVIPVSHRPFTGGGRPSLFCLSFKYEKMDDPDTGDP
jgi:hypothetical protein